MTVEEMKQWIDDNVDDYALAPGEEYDRNQAIDDALYNIKQVFGLITDKPLEHEQEFIDYFTHQWDELYN